MEGIGRILGPEEQKSAGIGHPRAGTFVVEADARSWFCYGWWINDSKAPDYARTVDIHRKPGYDPCELFLDPQIGNPMLKIAWFLLRKKLGFKALLEVIPLDATLVKGSHGRIPEDEKDWPVWIGGVGERRERMESVDVFESIRQLCVRSAK